MKNKNKAKHIALSLMIGFSAISSAHAQGDKTGGGGDVIMCLENGKTVMMLLDSYEAKKRNYKLNLGGASLSREQKINFAAAKYASLDPVRAAAMITEAKKILSDIENLESGKPALNGLVAFDGPLKDIDDAGEAVLYLSATSTPTAIQCSKAQLVRQEQPVSVTDPFYTIDPALWKTLDADQQVATILHEVIYKEFRENNVYLSRAARFLNGKIISNELQNFSQKNYIQFLFENGLKTYSLDGINVLQKVKNEKNQNDDLKNLEFDSNGNLSKANGKFDLQFGKLKWPVENPEFLDGALIKATEFYDNDYFSTNFSNLNILNNQLVLQRNYENPSIASMNPNGNLKLVWQKYRGPGMITVEVEPSLKVVSKKETAQAKVSDSSRKLLEQLFACVKPIAKKHNPEIVKSFLEKARNAVNSKDETILLSLVNECVETGNTSIVNPKEMFKNSITIEDQLSRRIREKVSCEGFNISAVAAGAIGVNTGLTVNLRCTFPDGERRSYMGIQIGADLFAIGLGAKAGKVNFKNVKLGKNRKMGRILDSSEDGEFIAGIKSPNMDDLTSAHYEDSDRQQYGAGLFAATLELQANIIVTTGRRHNDDYSALIDQLIEGLVEEVK